MIFLPIVDRELRVAARKRHTFWLRVIAALVAVIIGGGFFILSNVETAGLVQFGSAMFSTLTWFSLFAALAAGLFFTSDCLSEEKRQGTLGFLFLTDLRGYDVVLGKLLATSLRSCFALLAIFPILATTLLLGGVSGTQFWQTVLALLNALVCSLAVGLFISAISRDSQKALSGTLFLLLGLIFLGPVWDAIQSAVDEQPFVPRGSLVSPGYVFITAGRWRDHNFWNALLASQVTTWLLLGLACWLAPRTWQERRKKTSEIRGWSYAWRYGGARRRRGLREKLLGRDPMAWLVCRERWQSLTLWLLTIAILIAFAAARLSGFPDEGWAFVGYFSGVFFLFFYLGAASQSCRFFVEAQRSGLIELLLATPLAGAEIVRGHWRALLRMFAPPILIFLCLEFAVGLLKERSIWTLTAPGQDAAVNWLLVLVSAVRSIVVTGANLAALCWFGMWMGMTSRSANLATLKTLLFVQIIPWLVITFASYILVSIMVLPLLVKFTNTAGTNANSNAFMSSFMWYPFLIALTVGVLSVIKDIVFIALARNRLLKNFRTIAIRAVLPIHAVPPPLQVQRPMPPPLPGKP